MGTARTTYILEIEVRNFQDAVQMLDIYFGVFYSFIHPANDLVCLKFSSLNNFAVIIAVIVKQKMENNSLYN